MTEPAGRVAILKRIDELLAPTDDASGSEKYMQAFQGTQTLVRTVYGVGSAQEANLQRALATAEKEKTGDWGWRLRRYVAPTVSGTLVAMKGDIEAGLV